MAIFLNECKVGKREYISTPKATEPRMQMDADTQKSKAPWWHPFYIGGRGQPGYRCSPGHRRPFKSTNRFGSFFFGLCLYNWRTLWILLFESLDSPSLWILGLWTGRTMEGREAKLRLPQPQGIQKGLDNDAKNANTPNRAQHWARTSKTFPPPCRLLPANPAEWPWKETCTGWTGQHDWGGPLWEMTDVLFQTLTYCLETTIIYFSRATFY